MILWRELMSLKVTNLKKLRKRPGAPNLITPVKAFLATCDTQLRIVDGETVLHNVTKKPIKSWVREIYGQKAVMPKVGTYLLLGKDKGFAVDDKMTAKKIIADLKKEVQAGKHIRTINKLARSVKRRPKKT